MNLAARIARFIAIAIVCIATTLAAVGIYLVRSDVEEMRAAGKENILWHTVQLEIELMRFQTALQQHAMKETAETARYVNTRFDLMWSRVSVMTSASVGTRIDEYSRTTGLVERFFATMRAHEADVVGLASGDSSSVEPMLEEFAPFTGELRQMTSLVLHGEELKSASIRDRLSQSSFALALLGALAILVAVFLLVFFARESRRFRKLAELNEKLLRSTERASRAKSQFLTMMSHELRTPMNGVMGSLALIKQNGLSAPQTRLVDQVERSGQQMNSLLSDILDFAALQDEELKLESKPFDPRQLLESITIRFETVALREGAVFEATVDPKCPDLVLGDFRRLRQALTHLAAYLLETAGTRKISLDLSYESGELLAAISFDYSSDGGEWEPELIMGNVERAGDNFASEALGPAVARGLIERMGGVTKLNSPADDKIAVLVCVPAEILVVERLLIHIVTGSAALAAICKAAMRGDNVGFVDEASATPPHVVMIEAGGPQESEDVKTYARLFPQAMLVGLGRPQNPEDFDDIVDVPIDVKAIRGSGFMRLAS